MTIDDGIMQRDPARTLTDAEFWQLVGLRIGSDWNAVAKLLGLTDAELNGSIYEGCDGAVLARVRDAIAKHPVRKW